MNKKIIGLVILLIFLLQICSVIGINISNNFEDELKMELYNPPGFFGVNLDIENAGENTLTNIEWSFRIKAAISGSGFFIKERLIEGVIPEILAGETITIEFRPFTNDMRSPIGLGNLYMNASVKYDEKNIKTQKRAFILGFFIILYKDTYMDIKADEAYQRYQNEEFDLIIDVVGLDIYNLGHLPGAVNYIWADGTLNEKIDQLDPSLTYLVYCHSDPPSTASAQSLVNAGFKNIYRLEGNYAAWKNAGYPIET